MKRIRKQLIAFMLAVIMVFTTGCSSGFYADELLVDDEVSGNNIEVKSNEQVSIEEDNTYNDDTQEFIQSDVIDSVSSNDVELPEEQYHYYKNDGESVDKWMSLYMPSGSSDDFLLWGEDWYNSLYDYEKDFVNLLTDTWYYNPDIYDETSHTIDDCIQKISSGISEEEFFLGTVLEGITLQDLQKLKDNGYSIKDFENFIYGVFWDEQSELLDNYIENVNLLKDTPEEVLVSVLKNTNIYKEYINKKNTSSSRRRVQSRASNQIKVHPTLRETGYRTKNNQPIWRITLNGVPALCMDHGKSCSRTNSYVTFVTAPQNMRYVGYFVKRANSSDKTVTACAQVAFWIYLDIGFGAPKNRVDTITQEMFKNVSGDKLKTLKQMVWSVYNGAQSNGGQYKVYIWSTDVPGAQRLLTVELPEKDLELPPEIENPPEKPVRPNDPPEVDVPIVTGDILGDYFCETDLVTNLNVNKRDIETGKPLENVEFLMSGDIGGYYTTNSNGNFSVEKKDSFSETAVWAVTGDSHEVKVGEDSHGNDIKETKYYYTCQSCGQSGDYDSQSSMEEAGQQHCVNHAKEIAEANLYARVASYSYSWTITEVTPRTSTHTYNLVTGGTDSYTTGYHNNSVITQSNTESGYHRDEHRVINVNLTNERVRGTITINKSDMDYLNCRTEGDNNQDFIPQGDASLAGAVYGLYANADIIRPDGKSGDRTGLPTNIRMDYCTGSVDDPSAHKTYNSSCSLCSLIGNIPNPRIYALSQRVHVLGVILPFVTQQQVAPHFGKLL